MVAFLLSLVLLFSVILLVVFVCDYQIGYKSILQKDTIVKILEGDHQGRRAKIISEPSLFNGWHKIKIKLCMKATPEEIKEDFPRWGDRIGELIESSKHGGGPWRHTFVKPNQIEVVNEKSLLEA